MRTKALAITAGIAISSLLTACDGHAGPSRFPDLSGYTAVDTAGYQIALDNTGRPPIITIYFLTPDGIVCNFPTGEAQCRGNNFPAVPPAPTDPTRGIYAVNWVGTKTGLQKADGPASPVVLGQQVNTLPAFHSIAVGGVVCGVDDKKTTACKDPQGRGFVLSPSWSGWLEHIS